jgi:hypothetical protein
MKPESNDAWVKRSTMALALLMVLIMAPALTSAEEPEFQNPAQAQKALDLAIAGATEPDDELADRIDALEAAEQDLAGLKKKDANYQDAVDTVEAAEKAVADRIAEIAAMDEPTVQKISDLRDDGWGWGQIAQHYGIHPSVLGLGHKYGHTKTHQHRVPSSKGFGKKGGFSAATARDFKTGWGAKGHGLSAGGKGKGRGAKGAGSLDGKSAGKGRAGGKSNGKGGGKGGGRGGGNGGGKGGGNGGGKGGGNGKN